MSIHRSSRKRARTASLLSDTSDEDVVELHPTKTPRTSASTTSTLNWSKTQRSKPIARAAKKKKTLKTVPGVPEPTSEDHALIAKDMADAMAVDEQMEGSTARDCWYFIQKDTRPRRECTLCP